jgi:Uma2 family endonuclease
VPTAFIDLPLQADAPRKRWTRAQYEEVSNATLGHERIELIEGELISKMGKKGPHVTTLARLHGWLLQVFGFGFVLQEAPIDVAPEDNPTSEPEPDLIVTRQDLGNFREFNPQPGDLRLVVEISDTTLGFDLKVKARLYARAGIMEYWVLDVSGRRMIVHREPQEGQYRSVTSYEEHEIVAPLAAPTAELRPADLFL